jgi:hypothetical protein
MKEPMGLTEQLLFATVRIEADTPDGTSVGTGFMFRFSVDKEKGIPVIVTCKHVVESTTRGRFKLHLASKGEPRVPSGESRFVELNSFSQRWVPHPNAEVDLCAMPLAPLLGEAERQSLSPFFVSLDERLLPSPEELDQLQAVESVLMVGYPTGLWDKVNNFPLFRRGITASHPAFDYQGKCITVVDMACFPGSSGSPVLLADQGAYTTKKGGVAIGTRAKLLGVLFQGPTLSAEGKIVIEDIPTSQRASALTKVMIHLGFIIKSRELGPLGDRLRQLAAGASS